MKPMPWLSVQVRAGILLAVGFAYSAAASGQRLEPVLPLSNDNLLICEAGAMLGGGGQANVAAPPDVALVPSQELQILIAIVTRIDLNRDQQLSHQELQTLGFLTRQQLLQSFDKNFDRQLSEQELEPVLAPPPDQPSEQTRSDDQRPEPPAPVGLRHVRRFRGRTPPPAPPTRDRTVLRAATFGDTAGFYTTQSALQPRGRRAALSFDIYLRSTGQFELTRRCP